MNNPSGLLRFFRQQQLPVVIQSEAAECGLACLAMISSYYGHRVDLLTLRRRFPVTLKGATLAQLIRIAHDLGMSSRPLRLELQDMRELRTPCILHWEFNHFLVLKAVVGKGILVHDPGRGERRISWSEVDKSFTGVALELTPTQAFELKDETVRLRLHQLWGKLHGITRSLTLVVLLSLALQLFGLLAPLYMQTVVDSVVVSGDGGLLLALAVGFALLAVITATTSALRSLSILVLSNQLNIQVASRLLHHLLRLPLGFFERRHMGDIISRFQSLDYVRNQMTVGLVEAVVDGVMALAVLVMMFLYSPLLSGIVLGTVGLYLVMRLIGYRPIRAATEEQIVAAARKDSNFMETIRAIQGIRLFNRGAQREAVWQNHLAEELNAGIRLGRINILWGTANQLLFGLENVLIIYLGAQYIMDNLLSVGMLYAFVSYKNQFTGRAAALVDRWIDFRMLKLHLDRLADIVLEKPEEENQQYKSQKPLQGSIELKNLSFRYTDQDPFLFEKAHGIIQPGQSVAIVGPSGAGKSTLFKVLLGILHPSKGEILVDGLPLNQFGVANLRDQVGTVMQDDRLLAGSIADNISFFAEQQDMRRIEECARMAVIHDEIMATPMGYNTLIGDMGNTLSGGQAQRILLARALYRQPRLLLLDEATAHLDVHTERRVNENLRKMNITRLFIAHRPDTIAFADVLLVFANGTVRLHRPQGEN